MKRTYILIALGAFAALLLGWRAIAQSGSSPAAAPHSGPATPDSQGRITYTTPNTMRLAGPNLYAAATAITQSTYGATHHEDRPHAITLVRADREADAILAASRITHFPVNSPLLYVDADRLPPETLAEMKRLGPDGNTYDSGVQVYLVGPISESVEREVQQTLGYKTRAFRTDDPFLLSEELDTWAADVHTDHPDEVIIVQYDQLATGLPAAAGMHTWVTGSSSSKATRCLMQQNARSRGAFAAKRSFTCSVILRSSLSACSASSPPTGHVQRVPGRDSYEISVNFAGFRDAGMNQAYWISWFSRDFGWGIAEAGHNFTFVNPDDWQQAVTGSLLSHMGKHGPMILVRSEGLSDHAARYLELVKPTWGAVNDQLNNHGWILGGTDRISWAAQADIDLLLEPQDARD